RLKRPNASSATILPTVSRSVTEESVTVESGASRDRRLGLSTRSSTSSPTLTPSVAARRSLRATDSWLSGIGIFDFRLSIFDCIRQLQAKEAVLAVQRELDVSEPRLSHTSQALAHRIAHRQRAHQNGGGQRRAEQHAKMRAPVVAQASCSQHSSLHRGSPTGT